MKTFSPDLETTPDLIRALERRAHVLEYDLYRVAAVAQLAGEQHIEDELAMLARDMGSTFDALEVLRSRFPSYSIPTAKRRGAKK
jgi:hypothetical protein